MKIFTPITEIRCNGFRWLSIFKHFEGRFLQCHTLQNVFSTYTRNTYFIIILLILEICSGITKFPWSLFWIDDRKLGPRPRLSYFNPKNCSFFKLIDLIVEVSERWCIAAFWITCSQLETFLLLVPVSRWLFRRKYGFRTLMHRNILDKMFVITWILTESYL